MKKVTVMVVSLALAALMAVPALAGPGRGMGPGGYGPGYGPQLSQEEAAKLDSARAEFLKSTAELRKQLMAKRIDLRTELAQPTPDQAKVKALADEATDLRAQLDKARNAFVAANPNAGGPGWGRGGAGRGFCPGFGGGRGMGYGGGRGMGYGGGPQGGGFGPGACWR